MDRRAIVSRTVKIDVSELFNLRNGYALEGWHQFLRLYGWRAWVAVTVLKFLAGEEG